METEQVAVQPTVGGITQAPQNVFIVNDRELKDFYLKFALFLNPDSCSVNRTEFEMLNILLKDLKKIVGALTHLTMHAWDDGRNPALLRCLLHTGRLKQKNAYANERIDGEASTVPHPNGYGQSYNEAAIQKHEQALYAGRNVSQTDGCGNRPAEKQGRTAGNTGIHLLIGYNQKAP